MRGAGDQQVAERVEEGGAVVALQVISGVEPQTAGTHQDVGRQYSPGVTAPAVDAIGISGQTPGGWQTIQRDRELQQILGIAPATTAGVPHRHRALAAG